MRRRRRRHGIRPGRGGDLALLDGGDGKDVLVGGAATDTLDGGGGNDVVIQ